MDSQRMKGSTQLLEEKVVSMKETVVGDSLKMIPTVLKNCFPTI